MLHIVHPQPQRSKIYVQHRGLYSFFLSSSNNCLYPQKKISICVLFLFFDMLKHQKFFIALVMLVSLATSVVTHAPSSQSDKHTCTIEWNGRSSRHSLWSSSFLRQDIYCSFVQGMFCRDRDSSAKKGRDCNRCKTSLFV